ncbi:MAG: hypothetical protein MGG11_12790 [Trichodesmium sp. MAG_R03]|nr:hypothetical protein [Trichodesmium sp. MAG_R03]
MGNFYSQKTGLIIPSEPALSLLTAIAQGTISFRVSLSKAVVDRHS